VADRDRDPSDQEGESERNSRRLIELLQEVRVATAGVQILFGFLLAVPFSQQFEKKIREVASRAVAHIKRGDGVVVATTLGERVRGDKNLGADPILRFLALLDWVDEPPAPPVEVSSGSGTRRLRRVDDAKVELVK